MKRFKYITRFNTPAFLGNAFRQGQWRTPPFKALLRQWWRVVKACDLLKNGSKPPKVHVEIREVEGRLFGHAWLTNSKGKSSEVKKWAMKGRLKIRMENWSLGDLDKISPSKTKVSHKEVKFPIDPFLYLGYGPIEHDKRKGIKLKNPPAVYGFSNIWSLNCENTITDNEIRELIETIKLIHLFGTIGGRCRNGWGSLVLEIKNGEQLPDIAKILGKKESRKWLYDYARDLNNALELDWCHAIGKDEQGLLFWRSAEEFPSWEGAMQHLAEVKIALRTQFHFKGADIRGKQHRKLCDRQILAYPVTKHELNVWGRNERSANQLFFKVHKIPNGKFVPIVVHLPHRIPEILKDKLSNDDKSNLRKREYYDVWKKVHQVLDQRMDRLS